MGIDAQAFSKVMPKKLIGRASGKQALRAIDREVRAWSEYNDSGPLYRSKFASDSALNCSIFPLADWIRFDISNDGISVGFRTSNGGPGYHAAVIDMLDHLAANLKLNWNWGVAGELCADETGYALARDYSDLQHQMARFFRALMASVVEHGMDGGALCIPSGLGQDTGKFSCPLGPKLASWPMSVLEANEQELMAEAATFFPWWHKEKNSEFWINLLKGTLWQNAQWRAPITEEEVQTVNLIDHMLNRISGLKASIDDDLQQGVSEFKTAVATDKPPLVEGIGYRRSLVWYRPFPGWELSLPGYMSEIVNPDQKAATYVHGSIVLRVSSISANRKTDALFGWPSMLDQAQTVEANGLMWRKEAAQQQEDCISQFTVVVHEADEQHNLLMLTLSVNAESELGVLDDWLQSIRFLPPEN